VCAVTHLQACRATEYTVEVWVKPYFATHYNYDGIVTTLWNTGNLLLHHHHSQNARSPL
jgi:pantothenate kinase